jgi:hypothetical protein
MHLRQSVMRHLRNISVWIGPAIDEVNDRSLSTFHRFTTALFVSITAVTHVLLWVDYMVNDTPLWVTVFATLVTYFCIGGIYYGSMLQAGYLYGQRRWIKIDPVVKNKIDDEFAQDARLMEELRRENSIEYDQHMQARRMLTNVLEKNKKKTT